MRKSGVVARVPVRGLLAGLMAVPVAALLGCQGTSRPVEAPDTGLAALRPRAAASGVATPATSPREDDIAAMAQQAANDLESMRAPRARPALSGATAPLEIGPPPGSAPGSTQYGEDAKRESPSAPLRDWRSPQTAMNTTLEPRDRKGVARATDANRAVEANAPGVNSAPLLLEDGRRQEVSSARDLVAPTSDSETPPVDAPSAGLASLGGTRSASDAAPEAAPEPREVTRETLAADLGSVVAKLLRLPEDRGVSPESAGTLVSALEAAQPGFFAELENPTSPLRRAIGGGDSVELLRRQREADEARRAKEAAAVPPAPTLSIATATLCSKVTSFGRYEPLGRDSFSIDQPVRALVYVEVENFASKPGEGGQSAVELSQRLALFAENGSAEVWSPGEQAVREVSRRARRDFYLVQHVDLPRNLSLGGYTLKVTVTDKVSGAQAEAVIPLRIVAGGLTASGQ